MKERVKKFRILEERMMVVNERKTSRGGYWCCGEM